MDGIFIYDWRDDDIEGAGVGVSLQAIRGNPERLCSCYNVGSLSNPYEWDISIAEDLYKLDDKKSHELRFVLAEIVPKLHEFRTIVEN